MSILIHSLTDMERIAMLVHRIGRECLRRWRGYLPDGGGMRFLQVPT